MVLLSNFAAKGENFNDGLQNSFLYGQYGQWQMDFITDLRLIKR